MIIVENYFATYSKNMETVILWFSSTWC